MTAASATEVMPSRTIAGRGPWPARCLRPAGHALVAAIGGLAGCTSISWTDASGDRHHAGLVIARESEQGDRTLVERWTLGADLRLDGFDGGWTAGLGRRWYAHAAPRLAPASELCAEYVQFMSSREAPASDTKTRWRFLHFEERTTPAAQWSRGWSLGLDVSCGRESSGIAVPFGSFSRIDAALVGNDAVLAVRNMGSGEGSVELRCWKLAPEGLGRSESARR